MNRILRAFAFGLSLSVFALPACSSEETADEQFASEATGRFESFVGDDGQSYFHLLAKNGERLVRSEGYTSAAASKKGITSVRKNGLVTARYELSETDGGEFYFNLVATNGQVIATSDTYASKSAAKAGVARAVAALQNATSASVEEGAARFETFTGGSGKQFFRLRAKNGQIVLSSQAYTSKSSAASGIASVKKNAIEATRFEIFEGANGQHTFRLIATNGQVIGRGEMYASKSAALLGAERVRDVVRGLVGAGATTDAQVALDLGVAAEGLLYTSESDYPFLVVGADLASPDAPITEDVVRAAFGELVDADPDADKPMADLFAMTSTWQEWVESGHGCQDNWDADSLAICQKQRNLEAVLEANLSDIQIFYFGGSGEPGQVDGVGVSLFIVGRTPEGHLAGLRTIAIWT